MVSTKSILSPSASPFQDIRADLMFTFFKFMFLQNELPTMD